MRSRKSIQPQHTPCPSHLHISERNLDQGQIRKKYVIFLKINSPIHFSAYVIFFCVDSMCLHNQQEVGTFPKKIHKMVIVCSLLFSEMGGILFREYCFGRENSVSSVANSVSSAKNSVSSLGTQIIG